jgi:serine protease inhibitor
MRRWQQKVNVLMVLLFIARERTIGAMAFTKLYLGLFLVLAVMTPTSSAKDAASRQPTPSAPSANTAPPATAAGAINTFGLRLLEDMSRGKHEDVFISPLSVFFALAMAESGSEGRTRADMRKAMAVPTQVPT